jgi:cell wall-associated NlpC family hydrolase
MTPRRPVRPIRPIRRLLAASLVAACALPTHATIAGAGPDERSFSDVPAGYWAAGAIRYVAGSHDWMRDASATADGTYRFRPLRLEPRGLFARSLVRAFARREPVDDSVAFGDLAPGDPLYAAASVAVTLGWMRTDADGDFRPDEPVTTVEAHSAIVAAIGLGALAKAAGRIHLDDGTKFAVPAGFGAMLIGMRIGLRYDHGDDALDVGPSSQMPRAEVAWSLYRAATMPESTASSVASYADVELPDAGPARKAIMQWGIDYVGYPYVSAGEWDRPTSSGYCCGAQPVGGFDCSGLTWWLMKAADGTWDNAPPRTYPGWALPQRTSRGMAAAGVAIAWERLRPGDLMFYDGDGDGNVDHVDVFLGNGWAIDSSSSRGGVTIVWVATGWYADHFVHGRRVVGVSGS